jgi:hypothetical protein
MNGDGRDDLLGTWDDQGVFYRNSITGVWVKMASPATLITAGDIDGDSTDDLIGIWPTQGGVWVKYSGTGAWQMLSSTAQDITVGKMRSASSQGTSMTMAMELSLPMGGAEPGPEATIEARDESSDGPGGWRFAYYEEKGLTPVEGQVDRAGRIPGPGDPSFVPEIQKNLIPGEQGPGRDPEPRTKKK